MDKKVFYGLAGEKALVICAKPQHAIEIAELINKTTDTKAAVFHEEMSVIDRDKQAASLQSLMGQICLFVPRSAARA